MAEINKQSKIDLIKKLAQLVTNNYVFPEKGKEVGDHLNQKLIEDAPLLTLPPAEFAQTLTETLHTLAQDTHLRLDHDPNSATAGSSTEELMQNHSIQARRSNFGFMKVERLAGNIGYIQILELPPPHVAGKIAAGAMAFLAHMPALIIDLRGNKGGTPQMVQLLISYLVGAESRPLSSIYWRKSDETQRFKTLPEIPGQRMPDIPVYVLVDNQTHSGAEAFAYDLQALKRATIIGEASRGGAHLVDFVPLQNAFVLMLPIARAINPITGSNWEGSGVLPDIDVPAEQALKIAHQHAIQKLLDSTEDADEKAFLEKERSSLERVHFKLVEVQ